MAKWTLKDYLFQLRKRIDQEDTEVYSDEELTAYINEAIGRMAGDLLNQEVATLDIVNKEYVDFKELFVDSDNKAIVDITQRQHNFLKLRSFYLNGEKMESTTMEQVEDTGRGIYFWGDTINFSSIKTGTVRAMYYKLPKVLVELTDTSDIPEKYQAIPLEYAAAKAKQKDEEYGFYDYDLGMFDRLRGEMKEELQTRDNETNITSLNIKYYN